MIAVPTQAVSGALIDRIHLVVARSVPELEAHRVAWDALAAAAPQQLPMVSHAWQATFFEHMCPRGGRWACVFAYRGSDLVAVLPVVAVRRRRLGLPFTALTTPRDEHTQVGDLLSAPDDVAAAVAVIERARDECPEACYLEVNRFAGASPLLHWLGTGRLPWPSLVHLDSYGAYLPVPADYGAFRRQLGRNFRNNLNKASNKVARLRDVRYQFAHGSEARCDDLEMLMAVEASGWKGDEGSAISASPRLVAFYSALVRRLRDAGWLEWQFMHGDGEVLAGNLAIRMPRSIVLWKLGYNDAYSRCSPGSMLMEELLKRASADGGPAVVDMTTDQSWYDNWSMLRRPFYTARVYFGAKGFLVGYLPDATRSLLRRCPPAVALKRAFDRSRRASS